MMSALTFVGCSVAVLALLTALYTIEDKKEKRIFLSGAREALDMSLARLLGILSAAIGFFTHGLLRMLLHYGAHSILKRVLASLRKLEKKVEEMVRRNKRVAKKIHAQKKRTHLDAIAEHKQETALSDTQKDEMRSHR